MKNHFGWKRGIVVDENIRSLPLFEAGVIEGFTPVGYTILKPFITFDKLGLRWGMKIFIHYSYLNSSLINMPPTTLLAWNPSLCAVFVSYQSLKGTLSGVLFKYSAIVCI